MGLRLLIAVSIMKAKINKIIEFSNVDGPGNRLAIFFQGCPFQCLYCHNPETINICNNCGLCVKTCPVSALSKEGTFVVYDATKCIQCDECLKTCPNLASPKVREYTVEQVMEIILDNQAFIRGITVSGGECMLYGDFLLALFKQVRAIGLSCLIDSNGAIYFKDHQELLAYCDGVMLDVKASDEKFHREITMSDNMIVMANMNYLLQLDKLFEVRTVLLPNYYQENKTTIKAVCETINNKVNYKLIKYRPFGVRLDGLEIFGGGNLSDIEYQRLVEYARELGQEMIIEV